MLARIAQRYVTRSSTLLPCALLRSSPVVARRPFASTSSSSGGSDSGKPKHSRFDPDNIPSASNWEKYPGDIESDVGPSSAEDLENDADADSEPEKWLDDKEQKELKRLEAIEAGEYSDDEEDEEDKLPPVTDAEAAKIVDRWFHIAAMVFAAWVVWDRPKDLAFPPFDPDAVREDIVELLDDEEHDDGSWGPLFVRLAWHAAGTYDKETNTGGSNGGRMQFDPEASMDANTGLGAARQRLEPLVKKHKISHADLWAYAGGVALEEMGSDPVPFHWGREDYKDPRVMPDIEDVTTRLPDGGKGARHVRKIFHRQGFNDREIVALMGAHALGRCHRENSGYEGPWTNAPTTFSNEYFRELFENKWTEKQWDGKKQMEDSSKQLMMLPADMTMRKDRTFRDIAEEYYKDEELFKAEFVKAWQKLMENGVPNLYQIKDWKYKVVALFQWL